ncbi:MAG: diacylglycerol kinase family lipid kinase [Bacteroidales bacterium]|nr:diacylglycerol kinase family lipid kinase [Bacteroidales bacterium]
MTGKRKILAVINPISGTSNKEFMPEIIARCIDTDKFEVVVRFTQHASHATLLTEEAIKEGFYGVIAVGGDGTINEVAAALRDSSTALGIIPCGSGNGLARHLGIPMNVEKALEIINLDNIEALDYCTANDRPFFCTCGVGFDAHVSQKFAEAKKRGPLSYIQKTLVEYLKYRCKTYSIEMNDRVVTEKAFVIACGNASQYGNNAFITPRASMHDGLIDVTVIHPFTPLDTAVLGVLLFTRHIDQDTNINTFRTSELTIHRPKPDVMHIDGEPIMMDADIHIKCHKAGIKIFLPVGDGDEKKSLLKPIENGFWDFVTTIREELNI